MVPTLLRNLTVYKAYTQGAGEEGQEKALQREWKCSVITIGLSNGRLLIPMFEASSLSHVIPFHQRATSATIFLPFTLHSI